MQKRKLSLIIPVYNEEDNVILLLDELQDVLTSLPQIETTEILFIDDGSTDKTREQIEAYGDERVTLIPMRRNFGKSLALQAGFDHVTGDYVITLDGDLQDDPKEIPSFIAELERGSDLVIGWKFSRKDSWSKKLPSKLANATVSIFTQGLTVHDMNSGFKGYKREVVKHLNLHGEMHRYIPVYVHSWGFKISEIKVNHRPRTNGYSKFGVSRLITGFFDFITAMFVTGYLSRPLHFFGSIGLMFFLLGFMFGGYLTYLRFLGEMIGNRPLLFLAVLLILLGVQFFAIGLIGEMVNHRKMDNKKLYLTKKYEKRF